MNDYGVKITTEELKIVVDSLKKQRDTLNDLYRTSIKSVLDKSSSCFAIAGLDNSTITDSFNSTFVNIDKNLSGLINLLENNVIKSYSELSFAIKRMFTDDFASKLSELLDDEKMRYIK